MTSLIPLRIFLNNVFPLSLNNDGAKYIVHNRIFKPRRDCEEYRITFPIDWESIIRIEDRNWRMNFQGWAMFHPIMGFFDVSIEKEKIVNYFFDVCEDWYKSYGNDSDDVVTTRMPASYAWYDMSVGFRALVIAFFMNRIDFWSIVISDRHQKILDRLATKHINNLKLEKVFSLNNHGMFQIQGLMALIQLKGIQNFESERQYALKKIEDLVLSQYDRNGIHLEHSPHYHFYALTTFESLLENDWYNDKPVIKEIVLKANSIKKWIVDPFARPACIGDSIMTIQKSVDFKNTSFSDELEVITEDKQFVYSNFNDSGYSIFRSDWNEKPEDSTYLFIMGMYHSKTHKHRDCLSFEWFDNGKKILCDSGKYGYKSDKYRNYFLSNRAHNTVEIEGFDILKIKPYGSSIRSSTYKNNVFISNSKLDYPAIEFERTIYFKPNKWLVVSDDLNFQRARNATQWFHLEKEYVLNNVDEGYGVFTKNGDKLIIHCLDSEVKNSIHYGDVNNMQGYVSEKDFVCQNSYALGFRFYGKNRKLVTILALSNEAYFEALAYIKNQNIYDVVKVKLDSNLVKKSLIKNIRHESYIDGQLSATGGKKTYSVFKNSMRFDIFMDKKVSDKMIVMLPGAIDRSKRIYNFQRFSWSDDFDCSLACFLDPTVREENNIGIGWFQGLWNSYGIDNLIDLLKEIFKNNNVNEDNVVFFGSSAGGFSSLQLADAFPSSKIIAINPQIYVYKYSRKEYEKIIAYSYAGKSEKEILASYRDRLSVTINYELRTAPIYYYQNSADGHHVLKHMEPYLDSLETSIYKLVEENEDIDELENRKLYVFKYVDHQGGHSPPSRQKTVQIINDVIDS